MLDLYRLLCRTPDEISDQDVVDAIRSVPCHYVDLSITPGSVAWVSGTPPRLVIAGATITAGQTLYQDPTSGKFLLADSNSATAAANVPTAIALEAGADAAYMKIAEAGAVINIGGTVAKAVAYYQSETPGGIEPVADVAAGEVVYVVGFGITTANVRLFFMAVGLTF